jgi:NAD(P)-dependent dehydrogenase (short-subunit alcohol dehydrogenase family)
MTAVYSEFEGKVAIISGAADGIGRATAIAFARNGARVVVADINEAGGAETVATIARSGGQALFLRCDVSDDRQNRALVEFTTERFGRLDYAFNNGGISSPKVPIDQHSEALVDRLLAINIKGVWSAMRHQIPVMRERGGGAIVNTASILAMVGLAGRSIYAASKAAVVGMTRVAAVEYAAQNIRVNALCPGTVETGMLRPLLEELADNAQMLQRIREQQPINRWAQPNEIAEPVLWLCSESASFVVGQAFAVDGGFTCR